MYATFRATAQAHQAEITGVGIGVPGFVFEEGTVDSADGFIPFVDDLPMAQRVGTRFTIPCRVDQVARLLPMLAGNERSRTTNGPMAHYDHGSKETAKNSTVIPILAKGNADVFSRAETEHHRYRRGRRKSNPGG